MTSAAAFAKEPGAFTAPLPTPTDDLATREQVRKLVQNAAAHMDRGDRATAAALLEEARRLRPDPSLDYNLGIVYADFGKQIESAQAFERFLQGADMNHFLPERIADARKRLDAYEHSLARLRARISLPSDVNAKELALYLEERSAGIPLPGGVLDAPLWLYPGTYALRIRGPGLREHQVAVELGKGETREVTGEMYKAERVGGLLDLTVPPPPAPRFYRTWWFWTAVGTGVAASVALIAAGAAGAFTHVAPGTDLSTVDLRRAP